jgi:hypothetical protein
MYENPPDEKTPCATAFLDFMQKKVTPPFTGEPIAFCVYPYKGSRRLVTLYCRGGLLTLRGDSQ